MRVGIGWDIHPMVSGRKLILGGAEMPFEKGLSGHSDADVLCHAISDALLGAAGLDDIGQLFPDNDAEFSGASSIALLEKVSALVRKSGFELVNIDSVVIADEPMIAQYKKAICQNISRCTGLALDRINLKGKRAEGLGSIGRGEGIAAMSVALITDGA